MHRPRVHETQLFYFLNLVCKESASIERFLNWSYDSQTLYIAIWTKTGSERHDHINFDGSFIQVSWCTHQWNFHANSKLPICSEMAQRVLFLVQDLSKSYSHKHSAFFMARWFDRTKSTVLKPVCLISSSSYWKIAWTWFTSDFMLSVTKKELWNLICSLYPVDVSVNT